MRQLLLDFTRAPAPTFANFVPGGNAEAAAAFGVAARGEGAERVLYVWGERASGKTHLLKSFANAASARGAHYRHAADFIPADASAIVAVDDVEQLSEAAQTALFNAFNERACSCLVVAARCAPRDLPFRRDLATRLATGLTFRVTALTDSEKRAALAAHAGARGFVLGEEVASYLLTHARRDMGSLIAALDSLDRYSLETGRAITVPLLKDALQPPLTP
jgi:DnaA family protein